MDKLEKFVEDRNLLCLVRHNRTPYALRGAIVTLNGWAYLGFDCPYSEGQRAVAAASDAQRWEESPIVLQGETEEEFITRTISFWGVAV